MNKKYRVIFYVFLIFAAFTVFVFFYFQKQSQSQKITSYFNIKTFGNLSRGSSMIYGPGDYTLAPYLQIPQSKFYVAIIKDDSWCINEDCGLEGALIRTMGGWLQMNALKGNPDLPDEIGFNFSDDQNIKSIVLIGGENGKIAGIYLNKDLKDVLDILKNHPDLANFDLLRGVSEFGKLKVGDISPLKPDDPISFLSLSDITGLPITKIPEGKKFYFYGLEKKKYDIVGIHEKYKNEYACFLGGCRYPEPDPPHDFLFDEIDQLGGWFLANDDAGKLIEIFGLDRNEVFGGKLSIVVLTDEKGVIIALHPYKTLSDALTILSQYSELADVKTLYP